MPVNVNDPASLRGVNVNGTGGDKLGKVEEIYLDNETSKPEWAAVKTGLFGGHVSLVPMSAADWDGSELTVPFSKDLVKGAPNHDPGRELSAEDEVALFSYYGIPYGGDTVTATGAPQNTSTQNTQTVPQAPAPQAAEGDGTLIRSEERLHVGVQEQVVGRARLRKFITTETVTQTVPVTHEEVVIERETLTGEEAIPGGQLSEQVAEVTLHEERAVVAKETVAVEKIRVGTKEVTEQQTVSAEVRKENFEVETVDDAGAVTKS